jgi:hypothetical protein
MLRSNQPPAGGFFVFGCFVCFKPAAKAWRSRIRKTSSRISIPTIKKFGKPPPIPYAFCSFYKNGIQLSALDQ